MCSFVPLFFLSVFLESEVHLECHKPSKSVKGIQWESMCVSRVLRCFKGVSKKFLGFFKELSKGVLTRDKIIIPDTAQIRTLLLVYRLYQPGNKSIKR